MVKLITIGGRANAARVMRQIIDDYEAGLCDAPCIYPAPHLGQDAFRISVDYCTGGNDADDSKEETTKPG